MQKGYTILEVANVHGGDFNYFKTLVETISHLKAPNFGIKLQVFKSDLIALEDFSDFNIYEELFFDENQWDEIISLATDTKDVWIDVFDTYSVEIIEKFNRKISGIKLQTSVLSNLEVLEGLSKIDLKDKFLMLNVAGIELDGIQKVLDRFSSALSVKEIIIQIGYQAYPTLVEKSGLNKISEISAKFAHKIIYADHSDGISEYAKTLPIMALYSGAFGVEKHIMLPEPHYTKYDYQASITTDVLEEYIQEYNKHLAILNSDFINDAEAFYLRKTIQKPVLKKNLAKGNTVLESDFRFRRSDQPGLNLEELKDFIGGDYVLNKDKNENETLRLSDFKKRNVATIVACRLKSSRLKRKAVLKVNDELSTIELCLKNVLAIKESNYTVLATSNVEEDSELKNYTYNDSVIFHMGDADDVITRYLDYCVPNKIDTIFRITGDCPYISNEIASFLYESHVKSAADYTCAKNFAVGTSVEIIEVLALMKIKEYFKSAKYSEYMTFYFLNNKDVFRVNEVDLPEAYVRDYRLTLDYQEDLDLFIEIEKYLKESNLEYTLENLFQFLDENPDVANMNAHIGLKYKTDQALIDTLNKYTRIKE